MNAKPSYSSLPAASSGSLITSVNHNDVFMGRGTESNDFIGNQKFRGIVEPHKREYKLIPVHDNKAKEEVARKILNHIHALGGRFLKEVKTGAPVNGVQKVIWWEVEEKVALEKCKLALRKPQKPLERGVHGKPTSLVILPSNMTSVVPSTMVDSRWADVADARFFDFQHDMRVPQPQGMNPFNPFQFSVSPQSRNSMNITPGLWYRPAEWPTTFIAPKHALTSENVSKRPGTVEEDQSKEIGCAVAMACPPMLKQDASIPLSEDFSEFLLSFLEEPDHPRFTVEQEEAERGAMTDEERAAALSDLYGKQCEADTHKSKKAKQDLDYWSIAFLVNQMRLEIERIPEGNKRALTEAHFSCHADEFSDARLERFLRCEGMNAKLGAQRFVNYWEWRRELFGPEKFVLCMTLSEALRDDLSAVNACFYHPLPRLDASGRQLVLFEPCRHTREGYTSESMLRAVWYVIEVMAQENTDMDSGFVLVNFMKDFTIWDYDHILYERIIYFDKNCWPVKIVASHVCCPPWIGVKLIKPIMFSLLGKHNRYRRLIHNVPESQLLAVLSDYGIYKEMLPTVMGGTVQLDQAEWIADRRAAELKENLLGHRW